MLPVFWVVSFGKDSKSRKQTLKCHVSRKGMASLRLSSSKRPAWRADLSGVWKFGSQMFSTTFPRGPPYSEELINLSCQCVFADRKDWRTLMWLSRDLQVLRLLCNKHPDPFRNVRITRAESPIFLVHPWELGVGRIWHPQQTQLASYCYDCPSFQDSESRRLLIDTRTRIHAKGKHALVTHWQSFPISVIIISGTE